MYLHRGRRGVFFPCIWWKWGVLASCPDPGREMPVLPSSDCHHHLPTRILAVLRVETPTACSVDYW
jgi:hypothetical protein